MPSQLDPRLCAELLLATGLAVRGRVMQAMGRDFRENARPVAEQGGDVLYRIDLDAEEAIRQQIDTWPETVKPLLLVAEGLGTEGREVFGPSDRPLRCRVIIDPIDGTRGLMYDKRSAWFVAAVCEDRGAETTLADSIAAAIVELPTTKQVWADALVAVRGAPATATRSRLDGSEHRPLPLEPSQAETLEHGFAQIVNFFPGTKVLAAELMEHVVRQTLGPVQPGKALVFDDQYIATAGQMVELAAGRDRFCGDLRPLLGQIAEREPGVAASGLACHPYDMAGWLVAVQAGVELTDGFGRPLRVPLDVDTPVHWCGYANRALRESIGPLVRDWLARRGVEPD
jgi:fructose-1,6-bisphosphatase/inositol monophosphatase family enzyme